MTACKMHYQKKRLNNKIIVIALVIALFLVIGADAQRQMEKLNRGTVAVNQGDGKVYVGWRMLGTDPEDIAFNLYRTTGDNKPLKLNTKPITESTNFIDDSADLKQTNSYFVRPVLKDKELEPGDSFTLPANAPVRQYISIPLRTPDGYRPNDASVGDLDGDGEYDIVLKQEMRGRDNAHDGTTGQTKLEAYKLDGTFLWRIDLGKNIREGAHYTQFMVYDLDGDGKAEVACKTADGTVDGKGKVIGDPNTDFRNSRGYILEGPEFLTIFDGETGGELVTVNYLPPRGKVSDWGDDYGNRVDRFLACIAYLDGERPTLVMCRGYYTRTVLVAWNFRDDKLTKLWTFDSDDGTTGNRQYRGQGNHNLSVADVDGDGKDEIVYGACAIDDDGKGLYSTGLGHGDAMHLSDIDPDRQGLEVFAIHEYPTHPYGANLRDARTGKVIWGLKLKDPGSGLAIDIDPRHKGYECWTNESDDLYNCKGEKISDSRPRSRHMGIWWDDDLLREILDGTRIDKWNYKDRTTSRLLSARNFNCARNNGSKPRPCLYADILGDWREEVIWRTRDNNELRIFTTTIPTDRRFYTFMHDPVYRLSVAWQNVAYNQPTQTSFYLGVGMQKQPRFDIKTAGSLPSPKKGDTSSTEYELVWSDEFNKDGRPNPQNWTYETGFVRNNELQWYQQENARCENGMLIIEGRRERKKNPGYNPDSRSWRQNRQYAEYTSASLTTRRLHSWMYGRFEMRGRIDTRPGLWPAFWTLGIEGRWPSNGEIDIMEYYRGMLLANVAWATEKRWEPQWDTVKKPITEFNDPEWPTKFHIWRMDWDVNSIELYVDDILLNTTDLRETFNKDKEQKNPFRQPHYIILNLAIGGSQGGDPSDTEFPAKFEVDYVRIYKKKNQNGPAERSVPADAQ